MQNHLREIRIRRGLSVAKAAELVGVQRACWYKWEQGTRTPSLEALQKLIKIFNTSVEELFFAEDLDIMSKLAAKK